MRALTATLDRLPPSANRLYVSTHHGKRKSPEAKKYEAYATGELGKQWWLSEALDPNVPYELVLTFYFEHVVNKSWPRCKTRFVRRDVNNLVKLLEDIVARVAGVDDCATFDVHLQKRCDPESPRVEIVLAQIDEAVLNGGS